MTKSNERISEGLRFKSPKRGESATTAPLNNTGELLGPELNRARLLALDGLARQRRLPDDADMIVID